MRHLTVLPIVAAAVLVGSFAVAPNGLEAGFGITPPYVENAELTRNSIYEQRIMLVRGNPAFDMNAEISVDVPGANDWITIEPGREVLLPAGEQRVPIVVRLQIPNNARYDQYTGHIRIRTRAVDEGDRGGGAVSIALGAQVNVDIHVIDRVIREFEIRRASIADFNEARTVWWLEYPGKMVLSMDLKNTGNVPVAPSRVTVDIYDTRGEEHLERIEHTNRIRRVDPFKTDKVEAHLPSHLPAGSYRGRFSIYNGDEVVREGELSFGIRAGTIEGDRGYGFMGLSLWHKFTIVGPLVFIVLLIVVPIFVFSRKARSSVRRVVLWLARLVYRAVGFVRRLLRALSAVLWGAQRRFRRR